MTSNLDVRLGVTTPQIVHLPPDVDNLGAAEEAIELADRYGVAGGYPLDESQKFTLRTALGERADGSWAAAVVGDFEPRQSGKNDTAAARELAGLVLFDEDLIIHTAHEFDTANESFLRLVEVFENWDDLRAKVARIRYGNGAQAIELISGQRLKYKARTGGAGRGFAKADLVIYDEAQHLQVEHVAASGPARLANPNSQAWYMGSGGMSSSKNAWRLRKRALAGDGGRFAYVEHTAEYAEIVAGKFVSRHPDDVLDRDAWARAHPAYGWRVTDEALMTLYDELGPELFAREALCIWDPDPTDDQSLFGEGVWQLCCRPDVEPTGRLVFGVDATPDRSSAAIMCCDQSSNLELPMTEFGVYDHRPGLDWLSARVVELATKHDAIAAVDTASPAHSFAYEWERQGVTVKRLTSREMAGACGTMYDAIINHTIAVRTHPALNAAVAGARQRYWGDVWFWARRDTTVDVCPLGAASIARWVASDPGQSFEPLVAWR